MIDKEPCEIEFLKSKGWELVLTEEEDGCETWRYPWELRVNWHWLLKKYFGTQHYWDRGEALETQELIRRLS